MVNVNFTVFIKLEGQTSKCEPKRLKSGLKPEFSYTSFFSRAKSIRQSIIFQKKKEKNKIVLLLYELS